MEKASSRYDKLKSTVRLPTLEQLATIYSGNLWL